MKKVLFVCTGNSCRSIMAEAYFNQIAAFQGKGFEARSAGTLGIEGASPSKEVIALLSEEGIDPTRYKSKSLSVEAVNWADMVLVMASEHKLAVIGLCPDAAGKVRFLGEFNPDNRGEIMIPDPIGRSRAFYNASFNVIRISVEELMKWLEK